MRWQHVYPIRADEPEYHEEEVAKHRKVLP